MVKEYNDLCDDLSPPYNRRKVILENRRLKEENADMRVHIERGEPIQIDYKYQPHLVDIAWACVECGEVTIMRTLHKPGCKHTALTERNQGSK